MALLALLCGCRRGPVTLECPGALNIAVYCGGAQTHFADGAVITFVPESSDCELEAPLSAQMPLRSSIHLDAPGAWRCDRVAEDWICRKG